MRKRTLGLGILRLASPAGRCLKRHWLSRGAVALAIVLLGLALVLRPAGGVGAQTAAQPERPVWVLADGERSLVHTQQAAPAALLAEAGMSLDERDALWADGRLVADPTQPLPSMRVLQVRRALPVRVAVDGEARDLRSTAATVGQALWQAGLAGQPGDRVSLQPLEPLSAELAITVDRARELTIRIGEQAIPLRSAAATVGEALAEAGLAPQALELSRPAEREPLPADGVVEVVPVRESTSLALEAVPFETDYQPDDQTELDHESVLQPGRLGLLASGARVRTVNGQEQARWDEAQWQAAEPANQVVGYGTQVVIRKEVVNGQEIEYWRKVNMYATSYSPCRLGNGQCSTGTASGAPLGHGIAAVTVRWFRDMRGQQVYVPGYGKATIADTGGGIPGRYWIDLGYTDETYQSWHQWTTVYFLTPVPPFIPYILYP